MPEPSETRPADADAQAARLMGLVTSSWKSQAVYAAAELRLPDLLAAGPRTSDDLAAAVGAHPQALYRLLRALTSLEICRQRDDGAFELAPLGALLREDSPDSLRSWTTYWGGFHWPIWGHLLESVKTGESARRLLMGTAAFEHLTADPAVAATFNQAMVELTRLVARDVARVYDFTGLRRIVDVGGGYGELLGAVLLAAPDAAGVLFDLPHAMDGARHHLQERGLAGRVELVTGSFFESVPPADAYLLKSIIHDWDDEHSRLILANCRQALAPGGRLLIVERIMPERLAPTPADQANAASDLNMLVGPGGRERTELEFRALLAAAGFRLNRILPAGPTANILEALPA